MITIYPSLVDTSVVDAALADKAVNSPLKFRSSSPLSACLPSMLEGSLVTCPVNTPA